MVKQKQKWTAPQERQLLRLIESKEHTLSYCFTMVASTTGRTPKAVSNHYYQQMRSQALTATPTPSSNGLRKWTEEENQILIRYIKPRINNLHACFMLVSEQINRTPCAIAAHWYSVLSKRPDVQVLVTASENSVQINRKNGKGIPSTPSIWRRILAVLRTLHI